MKRRINPYKALLKTGEFFTSERFWIPVILIGWFALGWRLWTWGDGAWSGHGTRGDTVSASFFVLWAGLTLILGCVFGIPLLGIALDLLSTTLQRKSVEWEERNGVWIHEQHEWVEDE